MVEPGSKESTPFLVRLIIDAALPPFFWTGRLTPRVYLEAVGVLLQRIQRHGSIPLYLSSITIHTLPFLTRHLCNGRKCIVVRTPPEAKLNIDSISLFLIPGSSAKDRITLCVQNQRWLEDESLGTFETLSVVQQLISLLT
jgi:hypothetical protein